MAGWGKKRKLKASDLNPTGVRTVFKCGLTVVCGRIAGLSDSGKLKASDLNPTGVRIALFVDEPKDGSSGYVADSEWFGGRAET